MSRIASEKNSPLAKGGGDALVHLVEIAMDGVIAPILGKYPLQAGVSGFIAQSFVVALFNTGRENGAPAPLTVVARDFIPYCDRLPNY